MTLQELRELLDMLKPMRNQLTVEVNNLSVRPDIAMVRMLQIQMIEVWALERTAPPNKACDSKP